MLLPQFTIGQKIAGAALGVALWLAPAAGVYLYMLGKASDEFERGKAAVQAEWDKAAAVAKTEREAAENAAREKEARDRAAFQAALTLLELEYANGRAELEQDLAALRSDNDRLRVRDRFKCPSSAGVPGAAGGAAGSAEAPQGGLLREDAEFLLRIGREADDVVRQLTACQAIINAERK